MGVRQTQQPQTEGKTMNAILDDMFTRQISETEYKIDPYSDLLRAVVSSCPDATVVLESQQWSKVAAIELGDCTIYEAEVFAGGVIPFDPTEVAVQITYYLNRDTGEWDLAWVATWPFAD